jgi:hypothetical protein
MEGLVGVLFKHGRFTFDDTWHGALMDRPNVRFFTGARADHHAVRGDGEWP